MAVPVPPWLTVGALVTLPKLDSRTVKHGHRYRVVHVELSPHAAVTGVEVGVQPIDAPEYKQPKCVCMSHCARWVEEVPKLLA